MDKRTFFTKEGIPISTVTAAQMREVDRIATEEFSLGILQMMENAGRNLAQNARDMLGGSRGSVAILAGSGGNGGGADRSLQSACCPGPVPGRAIGP